MASGLSGFQSAPGDKTFRHAAVRQEGVKFFGAFIVIFGVIARLDRATQYSGSFMI
jgi:hypothetical protein